MSKENKEPLRAALYIRVSTDDQTEFSPDAQKRALVEFAKRNNYDILPEFIFSDEGFSGRRADKRPAFMQMIGYAKTKPKPFDAILVHKFDRFARSRQDSIIYKSLLRRECGVKLISATEPLDDDDKLSIIIEAILEAMAEYYSLNLAEEVKKGMTEKARRGELQTMAPLGYNAKDNMLVINEREAVFVKFMFEQFAENGMDLNAICKHLDRMGAKTKHGNPIGRSNVQYTLANPVYIGKLRWTPSGRVPSCRWQYSEDTIIADAKHQGIVSQELFDKAADRIAEMKLRYKSWRRPTGECKHWLSGLLKCGSCGKSLTYKTGRFPSFQCANYDNGRCQISHSISAPKMEKAILSELKAVLDNSDVSGFKLNVKRVDTSANELAVKENRLNAITSKLKRASDAYLSEIYTLQEYKDIREKLEHEQSRLIEEVDAMKVDSPPETADETNTGFKEKVTGVFEVLTSESKLETKINAVRSIVDKIIFIKLEQRLEVYYYD